MRQISVGSFIDENFSESEVENFDCRIVSDFYVRWFDIAMDNAAFMGSFECGGDLPGDSQSFVDWNRTAG